MLGPILRVRKQIVRPRLELEALEDRCVPTVVFNPRFGAETVSGSNIGMQNPSVNFLFSGSYWNTTQGQTDQSNLETAAQNILSGPYLSGLTQYGASGTASYASSSDTSSTLTIPFNKTAKTYTQPTAAAMKNLLTQASSANGGPSLDSSSIYVVVSDPTSSNGDGGAQNYATSTGNNLHMIWLGTTTANGSVSQDGFTLDLSRELADLISHPAGNGITVSPPSRLPTAARGPFANPNEITDYEASAPGQTPYDYRLNGDLVQAYWSRSDGAFIVPDGNSQDFFLNSIWNGGRFTGHYNLALMGDQLGAAYNDNIQIGSSNNGGVQATMNNETVAFDLGTVQSVSVWDGGGNNTVQQSGVPAGVTVSVQRGVIGLLHAGGELGIGGVLVSPNGQYGLTLQSDNNLVLYRLADGTALWATNTVGTGANQALMQGDGNFVLYNPHRALWASGTNGHPGAYLDMQDDGNLVIYGPKGAVLWATNTQQ